MNKNLIVDLKQAKQYLRVNGSEFDELITEMITCAGNIAKLYIAPEIFYLNIEIIKQGILSHIAIMFDSGYVLSTLPAEILQYYKPFITPKL